MNFTIENNVCSQKNIDFRLLTLAQKRKFQMSKCVKNENSIVCDPLHMTIPFLTKFEFTRILGMRTKQINNGAKPFIKVPEGIIDGYLIAEREIREKKLPFIVKRPIPNGGCEYWKLEDLELLI